MKTNTLNTEAFEHFIKWYKEWKKSPYANERQFENDALIAQGVMNKYANGTYKPFPETFKKLVRVAKRLGYDEINQTEKQVVTKKR